MLFLANVLTSTEKTKPQPEEQPQKCVQLCRQQSTEQPWSFVLSSSNRKLVKFLHQKQNHAKTFWHHNLIHNQNFSWPSLKLERCNPWPHVANRHISISQLLSLWRHSHYDVICATVLATLVLIMTSFSTQLAMHSVTDECTYITYGHLTTFNI